MYQKLKTGYNRATQMRPKGGHGVAKEAQKDYGGLSVREDLKKGVYVENLTEDTVTDAAQAIQILLRGHRNRRVGETAMNRESSRSHGEELAPSSPDSVEDRERSDRLSDEW